MIKNLNGLCNKEITLLAKENVKPGMPVEVQDRYTVGMPKVNKRFMGVCTSVKGKYATIAISGVVTSPYTGSFLTIGVNTLACDGAGNIKVDENGDQYYSVLDIDETNKLVTFLLDK